MSESESKKKQPYIVVTQSVITESWLVYEDDIDAAAELDYIDLEETALKHSEEIEFDHSTAYTPDDFVESHRKAAANGQIDWLKRRTIELAALKENERINNIRKNSAK